jgi:hypothetical protein
MKKKPTQEITIKFSVRIKPPDPALLEKIVEHVGNSIATMLPAARREELTTKLKGELANVRVKGVRK